MQPELSIVVAVKDEEESLNAFFAALTPVLERTNLATEILFVNDGSSDRTLSELTARMKSDSRVRVLDLSRNFGKEAALAAGLHHARGQAVITMDADLQDPPDMIEQMIRCWRNGAEMVVAVRVDRANDPALKRWTANWFYSVFNKISGITLPPHAGDFRLFDRKVVEAYRQLGERCRFNKGLFAWLGFRQEMLFYDRPVGTGRKSRWRPHKLLAFGIDGLLSFSTVPVRLWSLFGSLIAFFALAYAAYITLRTLMFGTDVPGYASLVVAVLFIGGVNMVGIGLLGEYIGRTFTESKRRPLYIVRAEHGSGEIQQPVQGAQ